MLDTTILKSLLKHEFYEQNKQRLHQKLFADEIRALYTVLESAHKQYEHDLSSQELFKLWELDNPVATKAEKEDVKDLISIIDSEPDFSEDVASDIIAKLWMRDLGKRIATLGVEINEGNSLALQRVIELANKYSDGFDEDEFGSDTTLDIDELRADLDDSARARFNIEQLARHVVGINRTEFGIIFATPNTGKTAFCVSLCLAPGGFIDQGFKVAILGNEEATKRTVVRAYSAASGLTKEEVFEDTEKAKVIFKARSRGMISFKDTQDFDLDMIDRYIARKAPDIVFIDQLDKVMIGGNFNASHERLREIYRRTRELAKKHNCAIFGISQASAEADGRTRITYTMMEGSKIGKAAEADLILGIGKQDLEEDDNMRFITVSKNKISGWHGTITCQIQPQISRYID